MQMCPTNATGKAWLILALVKLLQQALKGEMVCVCVRVRVRVRACVRAVLPVQHAHFLFNSSFVQHDQQKGEMTMYDTSMQPG